MFVQHSVHLDRSIETVTSALAAGPRKWLPRFDGGSHAEVGPQIAGIALRKKVAIEVGDPITVGDSTEVPITWRATFIKQLFPVMTGKVELAPVDPHVTRLTVCGMYQPPLGRLGREVDQALMHRVAEATVKDLAESIANRLKALPPDAIPARV